jgi:hypothetical protein
VEALQGPTMSVPQPRQPADLPSSARAPVAGGFSPRGAAPIDWNAWLRLLERKRRGIRPVGARHVLPVDAYYSAATLGSFLLDGIAITPGQVEDALAPASSGHSVRSRLRQRLRHHVGILKRIERDLHVARPLKTDAVVRWYTCISCGLSTAMLSDERHARLEQVVHQTNFPQLRLQPALCHIARLHAQILREELLPSFNGILARLILRYHLGRCGFPPVVFDAMRVTRVQLLDEARLLPLLMERIEQGFDLLKAS